VNFEFPVCGQAGSFAIFWFLDFLKLPGFLSFELSKLSGKVQYK
jgi:hypothetical protein